MVNFVLNKILLNHDEVGDQDGDNNDNGIIVLINDDWDEINIEKITMIIWYDYDDNVETMMKQWWWW